MASFCFGLISILMLSIAWAAQNFVPVSVCPRDRDNWNLESVRKNCQGDTPDYLCAAIENQVGNFGEICTKFGLTPANKCAVLNEQTHNLDSVDCKADSGCPAQPYIPSVLWQYQICFEDFYGTTTSLARSTTPTIIISTPAASSRSEDSGSGSRTGVAVAVVIILIIVVVVVVMVVFYIRNQFGFKDKVQQLLTGIRTRFPCFQCFQQSNDTEGHQDVEKGQPSQEQAQPLMQQGIRTRFPCFQCFQQSNDTEGHQGQPSQEQAQPLMQQDVEKGQPSQEHALIQQEPVYAKPDKEKTKKDSKPAKSKSTSDSNGEVQTHDKGEDDTKQKTKKLSELHKYLVHILKQELGIKDLKEKAVIHSKSINEHFSEPLIKELQSVKELNDYSNFDMSLVFALLRNFCEGIKPPRRGWDYEPPDDETHVGADIERIRSMWNRYCDNDLQFKYLDDVYNRMIQKYGTVAVHGDNDVMKYPSKDDEGFQMVMDKIQSIKLNEDCKVEKGIVITENISTALSYLKSKNVVVLKGVIGCGKTHALKAIQNHFQEKDWEMAWMEPENILKKISESKEKQIFFFCDNLFGKFGSSVFSQDVVNQTEEVLKKIERFEQTKVVVGIHTHVYDEVKKNFKLNFLHQKNITIEMDNLSEAEALLIFKEQLEKGHCKMDPNCWFKTVGFRSVLDKLSENQGHIGGPFLSLMYCNQHELFSDEAFSVNCIPTLTQLFKKMKHDSPKLYDCLVYLMCVQQHSSEEEPKIWAGFISADITNGNLRDLAKTSCLLQVENKIATLAHELLTTVLFKSAIENDVMGLPVLQVCESDVFLQLLRPSDNTHSGLYYEYMNDIKEPSRDVGKMCAYRLTRIYKKQELVHPLMAVGLVKEKYLYYLKHEPKQLNVIKGLM